jgi:hypothetical protein
MVVGVPLSSPREACQPDQQITAAQLIYCYFIVGVAGFAHYLVPEQLIAGEVCFDPFQLVGRDVEHADELVARVDGDVNLLAEKVGLEEWWLNSLCD